MNTKYEIFGVILWMAQIKKITTSGKNKRPVIIRLAYKNLHGDDFLLLTKTQIQKIEKSKTGLDLNLSYSQIKHFSEQFIDSQNENKMKTGGFLPLLTLLPLIFGGLGAAGGLAGGVASAVSSANIAKAQNKAQIETERHNRELDSQLKQGNGVISDIVDKIPVVNWLTPLLKKVGLGINECDRVMKGGCVCLGKGLYIGPSGDGLYIGP